MYLSVLCIYMFRNWCIYRNTNMLTAAGTLMEPLLSLMSMTYMELCLKSSPPTFSVLFFQFLNGTGEFWGWDLSFSTGERLQDSIMDEHVLILGGSQSLGQLITYEFISLFHPTPPYNSWAITHEATTILTHKTLQIKMSAVCAYGHNAIILLSGCWLIG